MFVKLFVILINVSHISDDKVHHTSRNDVCGRAPLALVEDSIIAFLSREGTDILVYQIGAEHHVTELATIKVEYQFFINFFLILNTSK